MTSKISRLLSCLTVAAAMSLTTGIFVNEASAAGARTGTAVKVVPSASAGTGQNFRRLVVNQDIVEGETIRTTAGGEAQLVFDDGTKIAVGPNSELVLEEYVFAGRGVAEKVTVNALSGSFRFISGNSKSDAYKIKTPTAVLAVRGTMFDFTVVPE